MNLLKRAHLYINTAMCFPTCSHIYGLLSIGLPKLKWLYDVAKNNIILSIYCNLFMWLKVKITHHFPHTVHFCCSSMLHLSETCTFFTKLIVLRSKVCSDWPAIQCIVIGRIPQALDGDVTPLTILWCRVLARHYKRGICCIQRGHNNCNVAIATLHRNSLCAQLAGYSSRFSK